jgi:hypothetical protein
LMPCSVNLIVLTNVAIVVSPVVWRVNDVQQPAIVSGWTEAR